MKWFRDLAISAKLAVAFAAVLSATVCLSIFSIVQLGRINNLSEEIASSWLPRTTSAADISRHFSRVRMDQLQHLLSSTEMEMQATNAEFLKHVDQLERAHADYSRRIASTRERETFNDYKKQWSEYLAQSKTVSALLERHLHDPARLLLEGQMKEVFERAEGLLDRLVAVNVDGAGQASGRAASLCASSRFWIIVVPLAVAIVGCVFALCISRMISRPLRDLASKAARIADGDLTVAVSAASRDEAGQLAAVFGHMVQSLRAIVGEVTSANQDLSVVADGLSGSILQIASANQEVSAQSGSVATTAEQMSATVEQVAKNATAVSEASEEARRVALHGGRVISEALQTMQESAAAVEKSANTVSALGEKSREVGAVLEFIEEIADQTNLLSLNAAIEAARAGAHGRGFAVVADEVRKLADKTVKATQKIAQTIVSIQAESQHAVEAMEHGNETVRKGRDLGERAWQAIRAIEDQVSRASEQTHQIAAATEQLTTTIRGAAANIDEIARGVGQNASATGEIARTAESLAKKAEDLHGLTTRFKI